jgi:hypothetical protein
MKIVVPRIYGMVPKMLVSVDAFTDFGELESVAVLGLGVVFSEAHNTLILQVWYLSIGTRCIFLHVELENGLYISVLRIRALNDVTAG